MPIIIPIRTIFFSLMRKKVYKETQKAVSKNVIHYEYGYFRRTEKIKN